MRVSDLVAYCPVFLSVEHKGRDLMAGTAFFIGVESEVDPSITHGLSRHGATLRGAGKEVRGTLGSDKRLTESGSLGHLSGTEIAARGGEAALLELPSYSGWTYHEEEINDVAVYPMAPSSEEFLFVFTERESLATEEVIERESIGLGDDLMIVGLFSSHYGRVSNRPIVRAGIIAAMPHEPLQDPGSGEYFDAYLAEVRSVGGLSGSPVWLVISPARMAPGREGPEHRLHFYLLGLVRGHWQKGEAWASDFGGTEQEALNTGIAIVTPIQKALDIIDSDEFRRQRRARAREHLSGQSEGEASN